MDKKHPKRPRDINQRAKQMVDLATMDEEELAALRKHQRKRSEDKGRQDQVTPGKGSKGSRAK